MKSSIVLLARVCSVICITFLATTASAQLWTFDSSAQGWRINDLSGEGNYVTSQGIFAVNWNVSGGNSGGFISATDPSAFSFMFQAPSAQLGNYSQFLGGKLNFSLETDLSPDFADDSVIIFRGGATNRTIVAAITPQPNSTWTNYSISLLASGFRYDNLSGSIVSTADFADVLGGLTDFLIDGEYHAGIAETTGLDSVSFVAAPTAVPEPSTYALIGALALFGIVISRRCSSWRQKASAS